MLEKFQYFLLTDPKAKIKILFFVVSFILICGLLYGLIALNSNASSRSDTIAQSSSSQSQEEVNQPINFSQAEGISIVDNQNVFGEFEVFFDDLNNPIFVDSTENLRYKDRTFTELGSVAPLSIYPAGNNLIINDAGGVKLFLTDSRQAIQLPENVYSIYPVLESGNQVYYSLQENEEGVDLMAGNNVGAIFNSNQLATFSSSKNFMELKRISGNWYIFAYDDYYIKGGLEIFKYDENLESISRIYTLNNTFSLTYGPNAIMVNQQAGNTESILQTVIDFSQNSDGQRYLVNVDESLQRENILGKVTPQRCVFWQEVDSLMCLVKILDVDAANSTVEDKIVQINYKTNSISINYSNILIGARKIFTDKRFNLYLLGSNDSKLYKFTDKP